MNKYRIAIDFSPEDEGYIAVAPDLAGCSAFGETPAEAATEIEFAIAAWIDAATAAGNPIPEPSRLATENRRSGKYLARLGPTLHSQVSLAAEAEGQSVNTYIVSAINMKLGFDFANQTTAGLMRTNYAKKSSTAIGVEEIDLSDDGSFQKLQASGSAVISMIPTQVQ